MAINVNLATLGTLNNTSILQQSNSNFTILQNALSNALSLNGQAPNQMQSALDMNGFQVLNLPPPITTNSPARLVDVVSNPTIVVPATGTSGSVVGLLNGNNTYSGTSTFTGTVSLSNTFTSSSTVAITNAVTSNPANTFAVSIGGASTSGNIPAQTTPTSQPVIVAGAYADSTTTGGLFQNASWLSQSGTRPCIAVFGQAQSTGSAEVWGGIFNAYASSSTALAIGAEIDAGVSVSGGLTTNLLLSTNHSFNSSGAFIQMQGNLASGRNANGIVFSINGSIQPITTNLIATAGAVSCVNGINFNSASFSGQAIATPGFVVGSIGSIVTGAVGVSSGVITFNGSTSGSSNIGVGASGGLFLNGQNGVVNVSAGGGSSGIIALAGSSSGTVSITTGSTAGSVNTSVFVNTPGLFNTAFFFTPAPVTNTAATYSATTISPTVIFNTSATCTVTMPAANVNSGAWFYFQTKAAQAINSASSNIVPATSTTAGTAILAATAGKFAALQSDGTNWNIVMSN